MDKARMRVQELVNRFRASETGRREFKAMAARHGAVVLDSLWQAKDYPNQLVAWESENFGYVLSARDGRGVRTILEKE